jgi:hypothetical protein
MDPLIALLIILLVLALAFWLLDRYVIPAIPAPFGRIIEAVIAIIIILFLLNKYIL